MTKDEAIKATIKEIGALLSQKQLLEQSLRQQGLDYRNDVEVLQLQRQLDILRASL